MIRFIIGGAVGIAVLSFAAGMAASRKTQNPGYHK